MWLNLTHVRRLFVLTLLLGVISLSSGCRGYLTEKEPYHPNPNLDWQAKYRAQKLPLTPPDGTVAWGNKESFSDPADRAQYLKADSRFYFGKNPGGSYVSKIPTDVTMAMMKRGQERYNIYCSVCHDMTGGGKGIVIKRGYPLAPSFHEQRVIDMADGYIFDVITNGVRNMPGYSKQISEEDRWAIVAYVRALQKMKNASIYDVPQSKRQELK